MPDNTNSADGHNEQTARVKAAMLSDVEEELDELDAAGMQNSIHAQMFTRLRDHLTNSSAGCNYVKVNWVPISEKQNDK